MPKTVTIVTTLLCFCLVGCSTTEPPRAAFSNPLMLSLILDNRVGAQELSAYAFNLDQKGVQLLFGRFDQDRKAFTPDKVIMVHRFSKFLASTVPEQATLPLIFSYERETLDEDSPLEAKAFRTRILGELEAEGIKVELLHAKHYNAIITN